MCTIGLTHAKAYPQQDEHRQIECGYPPQCNYYLHMHESDSLTVINMINKATTTTWSIKEEINDIHNMTSKGNFQFIHIFREGNNTADLLANYVELDRKNDFFTKTFHLPRKIVATMKNDEEARPNFKIRLRKNIFIFDPG
ncbi:hypothetical protein KY290_034065 [Solanum tuberosum]|uniref:RNase H type-1 domain-containing protein n=1 Tax=Solanum tuberosum TaxID=4113 RepID=A0ABQ7U269_SOLTU|nr:hypothetical protein KY289_033451 [Solanum tuberosum]KAH0741022.1 hypothetical protein KY290_034065 [Solanum tuberosum]